MDTDADAERIVVAPSDLAAEAEIEAAELRDIGLTVNVVIHPYALPGLLRAVREKD